MYKRMITIFCAMALLCSFVGYKIYTISTGDALLAAAQNQSNFVVDVATTRGCIYDCNFQKLVNETESYKAAVLPSSESMAALSRSLTMEQFKETLSYLESNKPFILDVDTDQIYSSGIEVFKTYNRYSTNLAPHIIGYTDNTGAGVYGLEKIYDDLLSEYGEHISVRYTTDATGKAFEGLHPEVVQEGNYQGGGLVLTLDKEIQQIVLKAMSESVDAGAAVVMDIETGDIVAMVSIPFFDPSDLESYLNAQNAPFVNRAMSEYAVGSTFKLIVAAAALENGFYEGYSYTCEGAIDVNGQIFHCHDLAGHGVVDMKKAIEVSCNPYFVNLGLHLGGDKILEYATKFGLGTAIELGNGYNDADGNLPSIVDMNEDTNVANFSFGQGKLLATPLQMARVISIIANNGKDVTPRLIKGITQDGSSLSEEYISETNGEQIIKESTAKKLRNFMVNVVTDGSGTAAKPENNLAGGKTASAQSGRYRDGEELVDAWFCGYFPAETPKYAIVVLADEMNSGATAAAPIFKQIADELDKIERLNIINDKIPEENDQ